MHKLLRLFTLPCNKIYTPSSIIYEDYHFGLRDKAIAIKSPL